MPAKVKVRILAGRNLPVMDKSSDASDAFVEVKLGNTTYKTEVYRRSLNPFWNSEWFRFEVSDQELQDEPLQVRIMDYDTYSANDAIGKVYINLNPLLVNPGRSMSGWLPIYDTLHGIRGEINCMVKVNLFADNNRYRHSSCGVRFFFSDIPNGYKCDAILGFVDELLVNDDPEYQWIDKIRTPRASNEARQTLFTKLSGEVQRKLGLKAEIFGGNAVIGYQQSFDLEGGSGIVGRGIGTAVVLSRIGYPFEGIISPLHVNNVPYPYYINNQQVSNQSLTRPTSSQSYTLHKNLYPDRHLVHSVSADYFYEVPTVITARKASNLSDYAKFSKILSMNRVVSLEESDESEYEDCKEIIDNNFAIKSEFSNDSSNDDSIAASSYNYNHLINHHLLSLKKSNLKAISEKSRHSSKPVSSSSSLINKLRQSNENLSQILTNVTKPIVINSNGLTRLLSFRKRNSSLSTTSPNPQQYSLDSTVISADVDDENKRSALPNSTSTDDSTVLSQTQKSTTSSVSISSQSACEPATSSLTYKRRRDKSQSTSLDDGLSIIEERMDDDDHLHQMNGRNNSRAQTGSSGKYPQITRTKEIELYDDSESGGLSNVKGFSISSADDEELDENTATLSSSTLEAKPVMTQIDKTILSSSSQSSSILTDETIKAKSNSPSKSRLIAQLSTPVSHKPYTTMRRSDTDLAISATNKQEMDTIPIIPSTSNLSRSELNFNNCTNHHSVSQQSKHSKGNFIQSVRAVKAQQHLVQTLVKHQNQDLIASSSNKAKNAFMYPNRVHQSEYPFVTLRRYPDNMIQCTGGVVSVHSVKLLDHIINDEESETRDIWWTEIRKEIRSHAKALNCNTILGYSETSKVLGDVCVLSASGTAAILKPVDDRVQSFNDNRASNSVSQQTNHHQTLKIPRLSTSPPPTHTSMPVHGEQPAEASTKSDSIACEQQQQQQQQQQQHSIESNLKSGSDVNEIDCSFCHTPLACADSISSLANCSICELKKVPDVLLLTIEPPQNLNVVSRGTLVQARVCRTKRDSHGEASAKEIGDALPFLEYELHRQLFTKLKFKGMNCLFNLRIDISVGENMLTGIATGTGCFVMGLPTPDAPQISAGKGIKASRLNEIQRLIELSAMKNRESLGLERLHSSLASYKEQMKVKSPQQVLGHQQQSASMAATAPILTQNLLTAADQQRTDSPLPAASGLLTSNQDSSQDQSFSGDNMIELKSSNTRLRAPPPAGEFHHHHQRRHNRKHHHHYHAKKSTGPSQEQRDSLGPAEHLLNLLTNDDNNIVLEVDDNEDADIITQLIDSDIPEGYFICNSESMPTINQSSITSINMFTQVTRVKLSLMEQFAQQFDWILQALFVKLRRSLPCCLTNISFVVDLPELHIVQISVTGCLLGLSSSLEALRSEHCDLKLMHDVDSNCQGPNVSGSMASKLLLQSSTTPTTSMSPASSSSSSEFNSPDSSSSSSSTTNKSGQSKTSSSSLAESVQVATKVVVQEEEKVAAKSSFSKKLSNSNIAALLSGHKIDKSKSSKLVDMELIERKGEQSEQPPSTTKATIEAVKQEIQHMKLGHNQQPFQSVRAVFKKQQTYPGATCPLISGQDKLLECSTMTTTTSNNLATLTATGSNAARRATLLLNKVKQPLKEFGSNFNANTNNAASSSCQPSEPAASTSNYQNSNASTKNRGSFNKSSNKNRSADAKVQADASTSNMTSSQSTAGGPQPSLSSNREQQQQQGKLKTDHHKTINSSIDITSLSYIPGAKEYHYLGNLSFSFVRETNSVRENGGLNGFIHCFLMEVYAIVRAHVSALGGNAFLSFRLQQSCIFYHSNKNQAQCLISVAGDAVQVAL